MSSETQSVTVPFFGPLKAQTEPNAIVGKHEVDIYDDAAPSGDKLAAMVTGTDEATVKARAAMFAAAPDLLTACKVVVEYCNRPSETGRRNMMDLLNRAVWLAEGGTI